MDFIFEMYKFDPAKKEIFEKLRNKLRGLNRVERFSHKEREELKQDLEKMDDMAHRWKIPKPSRGAGDRTVLQLSERGPACAMLAKASIKRRVEAIPYLILLTFEGECFWGAIGYYPPPGVLVIELTHLPAYRMMCQNPQVHRAQRIGARLLKAY
jgi:hypothetical protein